VRRILVKARGPGQRDEGRDVGGSLGQARHSRASPRRVHLHRAPPSITMKPHEVCHRPDLAGDSVPMLAKLNTFSLLGIEAVPVEVEVDVSPSGLPKTVLVGLPEQAVKESTHRVERAIVNSGFQRPQNRVVINLAPACSRL